MPKVKAEKAPSAKELQHRIDILRRSLQESQVALSRVREERDEAYDSTRQAHNLVQSAMTEVQNTARRVKSVGEHLITRRAELMAQVAFIEDALHALGVQ